MGIKDKRGSLKGDTLLSVVNIEAKTDVKWSPAYFSAG